MSILILADHNGHSLKISTRQAVTAAKLLGDETHLLLVGANLDELIEEARQLSGVSKVLVADAPHLIHAVAEDIAPLITCIAASYRTIFGGHSSFTRDVLPRVAAMTDVSMISDVIEILDYRTFKRPIYAGNLVATVQSDDPIQVLTIRGSRYKPSELNPANTADVERIEVPTQGLQLATWQSETKQSSDRPELANARIVISGGRSLGSQEKFQATLGPLAEKLNAAIGASRAAVDAGYAPNDAQVGQTGTQVAPDLYIAFGISGSIQHTAGIKDSKVIVAVNLDPDAPIFQIADYGLVADLFDVIPQLTNAV